MNSQAVWSNSSPTKKSRPNSQHFLFWAAWLAVIFIFLGLATPHLQDYAGDYDGGVVMQTAVLAARGFPLYEEVVLNKPPLLIWTIQLFFELGGATVISARYAILLLSTLGLVFLGALAASWWGRWAGPLTVICFLLLPESLVRAVFVTNDLPGMMLMLAALWAASAFRKNGRLRRAAASGLFFGLGFGVHPLLVFMLAPVALILIRTTVTPLRWRSLVLTGVVFGGTAVLVTAAWLLLVDWDGFVTWVIDYNRAPLDATLAAVAEKNWQKIGQAFQEQIGLVLLALPSTLWLLWQRPTRFWATISLLWLGSTVLVLSQLNPMWDHYLLFLSYPLVLLASGGVATAVSQYKYGRMATRVTATFIGLFFVVFAINGLSSPREWSPWTPELAQARDFLVNELEAGTMIISDEPFLIFAAGHLVPPGLADSSSKRIATGFLQASDVINARFLQQTTYAFWGHGRFQQLPELNEWAQARAIKQTEIGQFTLFQFKSLMPEQPLNARLEPGIDLIGYTIHPQTTAQELHLTLFWQAVREQTADYKIFVHLLDENGNQVAQLDADPVGGWLPTSSWAVDVVVPYTAVIPLPADTATSLTVVTGMYTWPDIVRLPALDTAGNRLPNDLIPITTLPSE